MGMWGRRKGRRKVRRNRRRRGGRREKYTDCIGLYITTRVHKNGRLE